MKTKKSCEGIDDSELSAWISRFESMPVRLVAQKDQSKSYEMNRASIFEL